MALASPRALRGEVRVPGDKSISHRAALLNAIAHGSAEVANYAPGDDCRSTLSCLQRLGVAIEVAGGGRVRVQGQGLDGLREPAEVLDCGNSGTTVRLLAGLLASRPFLSILSGDGSLRSRPMARVVEPLRQMGASIWGRDRDRLAPLAIRGGQLQGLTYRTPVASAQVKSAVLLAGLGADGPTEVIEPAPSRDHTERMLAAMGARVALAPGVVRLEPTERLQPLSLTVPGDFSSAAFWLAAACLHPDASVVVRGVGLNPGRTGLLAVLEQMGARVRVEQPRLDGGEPVGDLVAESSALRAVDIGGATIPSLVDELPLLAVLACFARGTTRVRDAAELRYKESDRIAAMAAQLTRLGARIHEHPDGWTIEGPTRLQPAEVDSAGDHRVAMALAVAGLAGSGVTIQRADCVSISYPGFWADAAILGAQVHA
ncbi:MAG: 3-phosphoshikimate 1-carboxyvinyltransferase [Chloroflexi bacterium]|nr:3-phosphoshikimate 1-carboxyvinyltransferase [Chloroflexota bacterium]